MAFRRFNSKSTNAITERFNELISQQLSNDPNLLKNLNKSEAAKFNSQFDSHLHYLKSEPLLKYNKHAKDTADAKPWTGTESNEDANLRMVVDSKPKPKPVNKSVPKRILSARELSSEYKETKTLDKDDNFRELYKERLLGPTVLINSNNPQTTLNLVNTMASAKINSKIDLSTGKFNDPNMEKVRGKPLNRDHLANSTDTSYFINEMLNKQEVLPPWVENQQNLNIEISKFRKNLDAMVISYCRLHGIPERDQLLQGVKSNSFGYITEKIKLINLGIRDYNLQSPSPSFHKLKLDSQDELNNCIDRTFKDLPMFIERDETVYSPTNQGLLGLFENQKVVNQRPVEKINVWDSFKQMFREM